MCAKGAIQLKNWKPLSFEQITDTSDATVGDILGDLGAVATLRIRLSSMKHFHMDIVSSNYTGKSVAMFERIPSIWI
ncbi:DNA-binding protein SATB2-like [Limulus polyphemus]|uniref:DNA-binding protein SATB2-like n=1 Tax=Limulus polyphemus TaxID=6850 RepID=A0ABM1TDQ0_LIMPO|nr:DNA-binding protein SATB2-like [Limulus polyphemus]